MTAFDDICRIVREECGTSAEKRVSARIRELLGTQRVYVPAKPGPDVTKADTVATIRNRHLVSRATAYNWLNKYRL